MIRKISALVAILSLIGLLFIIGCSSSEVTDQIPTLPGEKKPLPADTYVPKNMTPEKYLDKYYKLYIEGKFKESYKMLPASKKQSQSLEEYEAAHKTLPTEGYELGTKRQKGSTLVIDVKLKLKKYGTWTVSWQFVKKAKGYVVDDYAASGNDSNSGGGSGGSGSSPH